LNININNNASSLTLIELYGGFFLKSFGIVSNNKLYENVIKSDEVFLKI